MLLELVKLMRREMRESSTLVCPAL